MKPQCLTGDGREDGRSPTRDSAGERGCNELNARFQFGPSLASGHRDGCRGCNAPRKPVILVASRRGDGSNSGRNREQSRPMQAFSLCPRPRLRALRGVLTDIDDTLTAAGRIEPAALQALALLRAAAVPVIPGTRPPAPPAQPPPPTP